jgi:hypothetical protein
LIFNPLLAFGALIVLPIALFGGTFICGGLGLSLGLAATAVLSTVTTLTLQRDLRAGLLTSSINAR